MIIKHDLPTHGLSSLGGMNGNGDNNRFSANFLSLQLQLKTLLEEAGGDDLVPFLDSLAGLNKSEQRVVLKLLTRSIGKLLESTPRVATDGDLALKQFEDNLYQDLVQSIEQGVAVKPQRQKIEVLAGGKQLSSEKRGPISLEEARKKRKSRPESLLN